MYFQKQNKKQNKKIKPNKRKVNKTDPEVSFIKALKRFCCNGMYVCKYLNPPPDAPPHQSSRLFSREIMKDLRFSPTPSL